MSTTIIRTAGAALTLLFALSGCTYSTYDLPGAVGKYNGSIEEFQERAILTNIIRASEDAPLGFTQVAVVRGSGSATSQFGLPTVTIGGPQVPVQREAIFANNGLGASVNTNFDMAVLESKEFWLGVLTPLTPATLAFFINQGVPREILFYLYVQRAELSSSGRPTEIDVNNPSDPRFPQFTDALGAALRLGLTADTATRSFDFGPPLPASQASNVKDLLELAKAGLSLRPVESKTGTTYQIVGSQSAAVLCFDQARASVNVEEALGLSLTCDTMRGSAAPTKPEAGGTPFGFTTKTVGQRPAASIKIYPRSTYDIFRYLGALVKAGQNGKYVDLVTDDAKLNGGSDPLGTKLFVVQKNATGSKYLSIKYGADTYSIPKGATTTIQVLALARQLVALSTSVNALPNSGTVTTVVR